MKNSLTRIRRPKMKHPFTRINFGDFWLTNESNRVIQYAKQNGNIPGVNSILEQVKNVKNIYLEKMKQFIDGEHNHESKMYTRLKTVHLCKIACGLVIILTLIFFFWERKLSYSALTYFLHFCNIRMFYAGIIMWLMAKLLEILWRKQYISYMEKVKREIDTINGKYCNDLDRLYYKVDELYLNSLDLSTREMVLIRREQEKQSRRLREQIEVQEKQIRMLQRHIEDQRKHQWKIEQGQDELLEIERERERRRNQYR